MLSRLWAFKYLLLFLLISFSALTVFVLAQPVNDYDADVTEVVQAHSTPSLTLIMRGISYFGYWPWSAVSIAAGALLFLITGYRKEALFTALTSLGGAVSSLVKHWVDRARPNGKVFHVLEITHQQSFPSGHVNFYILFFGFIAYVMLSKRRLPKTVSYPILALCFFLMATIGISRIYLGAHFLSDVLAGYALGTLLLVILIAAYNQTFKGLKTA